MIIAHTKVSRPQQCCHTGPDLPSLGTLSCTSQGGLDLRPLAAIGILPQGFRFVCVCVCAAPCVCECVHVEAWCDTWSFSPSLSSLFTEVGLSLDPRPSGITGLTRRLVPGISHLCLLRAGITGRLPCLRGASRVLKIPTLILAHVSSALPAGPSPQPFCRWWQAKFVIVGCSKCLCVNSKHEDLILHLFSILGRQ